MTQLSEEYFTALFDNLTVGVVIVDHQYKIIKVNPYIGRLFNRDPESFKGKYCFRECEGRDSVCAHCPGTIVMKGNPSAQVETKGVRPDGSTFCVNIRAVPMYGKNGECTGFIELAEDITERKKAMEALNFIKAKLELALQSAGMGVWQFDITENTRVFDVQTCFLLGIDPSTFGGTAEEFLAAVHPDDREKITAALQKTIARDVPYEPEYRVIWPDGTIHYLSARARLMSDDRGNPRMINGILWDVTGRKELEEEMQSRLRELEVFYQASVGREERILELKNEVERLKKKL